jgi:hypothetical protein
MVVRSLLHRFAMESMEGCPGEPPICEASGEKEAMCTEQPRWMSDCAVGGQHSPDLVRRSVLVKKRTFWVGIPRCGLMIRLCNR